MILLFADVVRRTHRRSNIIFLMFYGSGGPGAVMAPAPQAPTPPPPPAMICTSG